VRGGGRETSKGKEVSRRQKGNSGKERGEKSGSDHRKVLQKKSGSKKSDLKVKKGVSWHFRKAGRFMGRIKKKRILRRGEEGSSARGETSEKHKKKKEGWERLFTAG